MMKRGSPVFVVFGVPLCVVLIAMLSAHAQTTKSHPANGRSSKVTKSVETPIERKLRKVLDNQEQILKRFDEVTQELQAVKLRVSR